MMYGISFRGKHSREIGRMLVKTKSRPPIAPVKEVYEELNYHDGDIDCSDTGGRQFYKDKVLELEFTLFRSDLKTLNRTISAFVNWMSGGYGELIFDDMPMTIWYAKPVDLGDIENSLFKNGKVIVQFRCRPFNSWELDSNGITLGSSVRLGAELPLGFGSENEFKFAEGYTKHNLFYFGTAPVKPVVEITTHASEFTMSVNGNTLEFTMLVEGDTLEPTIPLPLIGAPITIDCLSGKIYEGDNNYGEHFIGDFFELKPGDNKVTVTAKGVKTASSVQFKYKHKFLFGGDY